MIKSIGDADYMIGQQESSSLKYLGVSTLIAMMSTLNCQWI